jgi:hypothetical protein
MKSIYVPVTQNNLNYIKHIHPTDVRISVKDDLGLRFLAILKLLSSHYRQRHEKVNKEKYPVYLKLLVSPNQYNSVKNISQRGFHALNNKIDIMMKRDAYAFVRNKRKENPKCKIVDAITEFCDIYGLTMSEKQLSTLDRYERRLREQNGELLYKQNRRNQDGTSKTEH